MTPADEPAAIVGGGDERKFRFTHNNMEPSLSTGRLDGDFKRIS
jgi:hypothetical protein